MSYAINSIPIRDFGFAAGWMSRSNDAYALNGTLSLPKRTGVTHYDWGGVIEPYVDADDITFDVRNFELSLTAKAASLAELNIRLTSLYAAFGGSFTLNSDLQGSFEVIPVEAKVTHYRNGWGVVAIKLRELFPMLYTDLNVLTAITPPHAEGIDGYSWRQLGFVVSGLDARYDLPQFEPLSLTAQNHAVGYRKPRTVTLKGTIRATTYADLKAKADTLHAVIARAGVRTIKYFDGTTRSAFAVDGIKIDNIMAFGTTTHWARAECKMIEL